LQLKSLILPKNKRSSHFVELLKTTARYVIAFGGRGSGKTHHIIIKLLLRSFLKDYNQIIYVNKEFRHIKTQQFADIKKVAKALGLFKYFKFYEHDYTIKNLITGTLFIPVGLDDPEKTKGISDPTVIWWDEINKGSEEDFLALNALLRTPLNPLLQFIISFNPVSEFHWLRKYFFDEKDAYKLKSEYEGIAYLNHSTYLDNDFIDKEAYLKTLELNAKGNTNRMIVDIKGLWGVLQNTNPFFYALNTAHVSYDHYTVNSSQYLDISFDFNANPCTAVIGQMSYSIIPGTNKTAATFHVFDYIQTNEDTMGRQGFSPLEALCILIKKKYLDSGITIPSRLRITGDASGTHGDADKRKNYDYYTTIATILQVSEKQIRNYLRAKNLAHESSGNICNYALRVLGPQILIHNEFCQILIQEIESAFADNKGTLNTWKKESGGHGVDAFRYLLTDLWFRQTADRWKKLIENYKIAA